MLPHEFDFSFWWSYHNQPRYFNLIGPVKTKNTPPGNQLREKKTQEHDGHVLHHDLSFNDWNQISTLFKDKIWRTAHNKWNVNIYSSKGSYKTKEASHMLATYSVRY
jgi:hypothetical protein